MSIDLEIEFRMRCRRERTCCENKNSEKSCTRKSWNPREWNLVPSSVLIETPFFAHARQE